MDIRLLSSLHGSGSTISIPGFDHGSGGFLLSHWGGNFIVSGTLFGLLGLVASVCLRVCCGEKPHWHMVEVARFPPFA